MRRAAAFLLVFLFTQHAFAQDTGMFDLGDDAFRAGSTVVFDGESVDDLFMAGETVRAESNIGGSAHLAGRRVTLEGEVAGDVYAAGMDVTLDGEVAGDATVAGYSLRVGEVGGDLRATGSDIVVTGDVDGTALLAGDRIEIDGVLSGDAAITARELDFGSGARVEGQLTLYEESDGALDVPERVADPGQITRREVREWDKDLPDMRPFDLGTAVAKFLMGVVVVAALAAIIAAIVPERLAEMRRTILDRPFRMLGLGFLAEAALIGSAVLFAVTLIGIFLSPASLLLAGLAAFVGYVIAAYAFGAGLLIMTGQGEPDSIGDRALAAGLGALIAGLVSLIPFLGWLFVLALTLVGVGALSAKLFGRRFSGPEVGGPV